MPKVSKDSAANVDDMGDAVDRHEDIDGYTVNFTSIRQDSDLAPLFKGFPDDACSCPHWGYLFSGRLTWRYGDREEVIEPGEAFYIPPGHTPKAVAGSEFVMFSPTEQYTEMVAGMMANAQKMQGA